MPRIRLTSTGYAYRAQTARLADSVSVAVSASDGGGWIREANRVILNNSLDWAGIGLDTPINKLYVVENTSGL
jgi:hypothetical protein